MIFLSMKPEFLFSMPGGSEWIFILVQIILFFGGKKIPELMRGIGRGAKEFKNAKENVKTEINGSTNEKGSTP